MSRKIVLLLLLLICPLAASAPAQTALPAPDRAERLRLFDQVWQSVCDNYYDPAFNGVDWRRLRQDYRGVAASAATRADLYAVFRKMLGELGDAHTRIYAPEESFDRYRPSGVTIGITVRPIEGVATVTWVEPGSEAEVRGIRAGLRVVRIDGQPVAGQLDRLRRELVGSSTATSLELQCHDRLFFGMRGTATEVVFEDDQSRLLTVSLTRRFVEHRRRVSSRMLAHRIGYIEITGFGPEIEHEFDEAMMRMQDSQGLIIDLRNNGGGFVNSVLHVASYFLPPDTDLGRFVSRQGGVTMRRTSAAQGVYRAPLTILVSSRSASGAEILAAAMQERRRAMIVGSHETTCGCLLGVSQTIHLFDGGRLNISDSDFLTSAGRRIEGSGLQPDILVRPRTRDLTRGDDRLLQSAIEATGRRIAFGERHREVDFSLEIPSFVTTSNLQN